MSLARAFTTRRHGNKKSLDISAPLPQRSLTTKKSFASGAIQRNKISAPVELVSTTNMLSYNAPDLHAGRSSTSGDESDHHSRSSSPPTSPDASSMASAPTSPEPNHLSCYFSAEGLMKRPAEETPVPKIPQRALTHNKQISSLSLSSKRSMSQLSATKNHTPKHTITTSRSSANLFSAAAASEEMVAPHPFGNELAKVTELAEEFGVQKTMQIIDEEEQELISKGLFKFRAEDYMSEIHGLFVSAFGDPRPPIQAMWI